MDSLPENVRVELNAKIKENGFGGYKALSDWLVSQGFEIKKTTVAKYGKAFKDRLERLRDATQQAKFLADEFPDDDGSMNDALLRDYQAKLFTAMQDLQIDAKNLDVNKLGKIIGDLSRASVSQKKFAKEFRADMRARAQAGVENGDWEQEAAEQASRIMGFE